jgi:hypothetical protein
MVTITRMISFTMANKSASFSIWDYDNVRPSTESLANLKIFLPPLPPNVAFNKKDLEDCPHSLVRHYDDALITSVFNNFGGGPTLVRCWEQGLSADLISFEAT